MSAPQLVDRPLRRHTAQSESEPSWHVLEMELCYCTGSAFEVPSHGLRLPPVLHGWWLTLLGTILSLRTECLACLAS